MLRPSVVTLLVSLAAAVPARADRCSDVLARIGPLLAGATCTTTTDLTTNGATTTPADNSIPGFPLRAITPQTDRSVISPKFADKTPIMHAVPGVQIDGQLATDSTGQARFLLRLPDDWNGKLVVAGASGTRSEFNGDWAWSDYVVQKGYAYASQNKGVLNLVLIGCLTADNCHPVVQFTPPDDLACRLNPASPLWVHFFDNAADKPFSQWQFRMVEAAAIARVGVHAAYGRHPRRTYAVGTSNGGYQVRRAVELAPFLFDGGVDWEGTFVDGETPNLLSDLPPAIQNFPAYKAAGYDAGSAAALTIRAAGYPPDIVRPGAGPNGTALSLWEQYYNQFWEVTQCQWQKRLDPGYDTYGSGTGTYDYFARAAAHPEIEANIDAFETTGKIKVPLITVAGTMDGLLPIQHHARAYAAKVDASRKGNNDHRAAQYRLYEVQNGNHIETYRDTFPQLEYIQPHAQAAFDLLVKHVEENQPLPPSQCIPHSGSITQSPAQAGHCAQLFVP